MSSQLYEFLLRQGDNTLVLGQRMSEWCGVAPALEEDIALANTALDLIGQTQMWLGLAGDVEGKGRTADDLAYFRDAWDFRNLLMLERPNGDFGHTLLRQFLFDAFQVPSLRALQSSADKRIADIASKSLKEALYHLERSQETVIALGDGTDQSNQRMQNALDLLWPFVGEMFINDDIDMAMHEQNIAPDPVSLRAEWDGTVQSALRSASLLIPDDNFCHKGGKNGRRHTEHLGHLLAIMQSLPRSYPDARW